MRFFILVLTFSSSILFAQKFPVSPNLTDDSAQRIGHWTILYDSVWNEVHDKDSAHYYRLVRFENGKPIGKVRDFYRNGNRQWDGELLSLEPFVMADGATNNYFENGKLESTRQVKNRVYHGPMVEYFRTGSLSTSGNYVDGKLEGMFSFYHQSGEKLSQILYKNGSRQGKATFYRKDGSIEKIVNYVDGLLSGGAILFDEQGNKSELQIYNRDTINGKYVALFSDGSVNTSGSYVMGKQDGIWMFHHSPGAISSTGKYVLGKSEGEWLYYYPNGRLKEKYNFQDNTLQGPYFAYYESGLIREKANFLNGYKEGYYEAYFENGTLKSKGDFTGGRKHKNWVEYFESGKVKEELIYKEDTLHGLHTIYFENGAISATGSEHNDLKSGLWKIFQKEGAMLDAEGEFKAGIKNGIWKYYFENGSLSSLEQYNDDGILHGPSETYHPNGQLKTKEMFINGKRNGGYEEYWTNGALKVKATMKDDRYVGPYTEYFSNGVVYYQVNMGNGSFNGFLTMNHPNGKLYSSGNYINNLSHGKIVGFSKSGVQHVITHSNMGVLDGPYIEYDTLSGKKNISGNYVKGKKHGPWITYTNGKKRTDHFVNGFHETIENIQDSINFLIDHGKAKEALTLNSWLYKVCERDAQNYIERYSPLRYRAKIYRALGEYEDAYRNSKNYLSIVERNSQGPTVGLFNALNAMGIESDNLDKYDDALSYYTRSMDVARQLNQLSDYYIAAMNKAKLLKNQKSVSDAFTFLQETLQKATQEHGDSISTWGLRAEMAEFFYDYSDKNDEARLLTQGVFSASRKYKVTNQYNKYLQLTYDVQGRIEYNENNYRLAKAYYDSARLYCETYNQINVTEYAESLVHLFNANSYILTDNGQPQDTVTYGEVARKVIKLLDVIRLHDLRSRMLKNVHEYYYTLKKDFKQASRYSQISMMEAKAAGRDGQNYYAGLLQDFAVSEFAGGGDTLRAQQAYEESIVIRKKNSGGNSKDYYDAAFQLAYLYYQANSYKRAIKILEEEVIPAATVNLDTANLIQSQNYVASAYYRIGNYNKSIAHHDLALPLSEAKLTTNNKAYVQSNLSYLSNAYEILGDYKRAEQYAQKMIDNAQKWYGATDAETYSAKDQLADVLSASGNYSDAIKLYEEVENGYRNDLGYDVYGSEFLNVLDSHIKALRGLGEYKKAYALQLPYMPKNYDGKIPSWKYSFLKNMCNLSGNLKMKEEEHFLNQLLVVSKRYYGPTSGYLVDLFDMVEFYEDNNRWEEAEVMVQEAEKILRQEAVGQTSLGSYSMALVAKFYSKLDKNKEAEELFNKAYQLINPDSVTLKDHFAFVVDNLASFYNKVSRTDEASALWQNLAAYEARHNGKTFFYYKILDRFILTLIDKAEYERAKILTRKTLPEIEEELGQYNWLVLRYHERLADIAEYTRDFTTAANEYRFIVDAYKLIPNPENIELSNTAVHLYDLARNLIRLNRMADAEKLMIEADALYKKSGNVITSRARLSENRVWSRVYEARKDWATANQYWNKALNTMLGYIKTNFTFMSEDEKAKLWASYKPIIYDFYSYGYRQSQINPAYTGELYNLQLSTKAVLFSSTNKVRKRILSSNDSTLVNMFYRWQQYRNSLAQLITAPGYSKGKADTLRQTINKLEKELNIAGDEIGESQEAPITWKHVQAQLKSSEAAVEIIKYRYYDLYNRDSSAYVALVITAESKAPQLIPLENGRILEGRALRYYKNSVAGHLPDTVSYRYFWKKLDQQLADKTVIYISLDGVYNSISLNSLQDHTGKYLIDEKKLVLLSNTRDLIEVKGRKIKARRLESAALVGYPTYFLGQDEIKNRIDQNKNKERDISTADRTGIALLPGTKAEVEKIAQILKPNQLNVDVYLNNDASEETIKELHHPSILHIATHGFFFDHKETNQQLSSFTDPMLRAGLLLTGSANFLQDKIYPQKDNGILTAFEAVNLGLDNTDLVVLSACETGKGEIENGEGVYGLQRAFQTAGAQSILMSLWKVDDQATQELMTLFYQGWMKGLNKSEAFRQAQLELKKKYSNPYYWAAFVMSGS